MLDLGGLYNWLKDQGDAKLLEADINLNCGGCEQPHRMLIQQSRAYYNAAEEIRQQLMKTDPKGDWRRWEDRQYWSN